MSMTEQYVFTPDTGDGFVNLSRTKSGRLVRKEILQTGTLNYPKLKGGKLEITDDILDQIVTNFDNKVCDIVQFPIVDGNNAHTEDPMRNAGEVMKLKHEGNSLYAYIDVRKPEVIEGIENKTVLGASAMLSVNYTDTRTGKTAGPTLLHVAGTNRPHVLDLEDFEVIAASVDGTSEAVLLSRPTDEEKTPMETLNETLERLKTEHGIDVPALQAAVTDSSKFDELSTKLSAALDNSGVIKLSNGETASAEDLVIAVGKLVDDKVELSGRVDALDASFKRKEAEVAVDKLVDTGFVAEAARDGYVELKLTNETLFKTLVPEQPIINLSGEPAGVVPVDESKADLENAEIDRYAKLAAEQ